MKKRTWIILGIVVVLAAGGVYLATRPAGSQNQGLANVQTAKVVRTTLALTVQSSGSVLPAADTPLSFGTTGTVAQVKVVPSDQVKKGDVLASLDTADLQLKVTQAEQAYLIQQLTYSNTVQPDPAQVAVAQASYNTALTAYNAAQQSYSGQSLQLTVQCSQLTTAQNNLNLAQTAYDRLANDVQAKNYLNSDWGPFQSVVNNLTNAQSAYDQALANCDVSKLNLNDSSLRSARAQLQSARSSLDDLISPGDAALTTARAQLEQARLSLEQAKNNLAKATLVAPFDGVITAVNIQAGDASGSGAAIEMADVSKLHVDVLVDETEIATVKPGQKVDLTLDAMSGITLTGQVANIDPAGTVSQGVVNYNVRVDLDPTSAPLRLDMTANATILGESHVNVLAVPSAAVRSGGFGGQGGFAGQAGQGGFGGQFPQGGSGGQGGFGGGAPGQARPTLQAGEAITGTQSGRQRIQGSFVMVMQNGQPVPVPVTVGLTANGLTEVSGNLQEGDLVEVGTLTRTTTNANGGPGPGPGFFGGGGRPFD